MLQNIRWSMRERDPTYKLAGIVELMILFFVAPHKATVSKAEEPRKLPQ